MSDNDLIRRGDAIALTCDPFGAETVTSQAINAIPAALPTVKPLVWDAFGKECVRSETVLGRYEIMWGFHNGQTSLDIPAPRRTHVWHPTLEAAKAAAQADYEARILSALNMQPTVSPDVAALVEAAEKVRDSYWYSSDGIITGMHDLETALARVKGVM